MASAPSEVSYWQEKQFIPASAPRVVSSAIFAFSLVALEGFAVSNATTKYIVGQEQGVLATAVSTSVAVLATVVAGFVAGYRAVGRGWVAGLLVGVLTILGFAGLLVLFAQSTNVEYWLGVYRRLSAEAWIGLLGLALAIPCGAIGGRYGDEYYREAGHLEDAGKHTLFQIPWWHWVWLFVLGPALIVSDLALSAHLFVLAGEVAWNHLRHFFLIGEDVFGYISPVICLAATGYGAVNIHDALSIRTTLPLRNRWVKALWGLVLLMFIVPSIWKIVSGMALAALH